MKKVVTLLTSEKLLRRHADITDDFFDCLKRVVKHYTEDFFRLHGIAAATMVVRKFRTFITKASQDLIECTLLHVFAGLLFSQTSTHGREPIGAGRLLLSVRVWVGPARRNN